MSRLLLLIPLIGLLFIAPDSLAKSPKPTRATIKYKTGDKYVGEVWKRPKKYSEYALIQKVFIGNEKLMHGNGIMYYANGNRLDGYWQNNYPIRGRYTYANGNIFDGEFGKDSVSGTLYYAVEGEIQLGHEQWRYPANCQFIGTIQNRTRYTGKFDCILLNKDGDRFTGDVSFGELDNGKIEYANGDVFEGIFFNANTPLSGQYHYGDTTEIAKSAYKWRIPAGCTFDGNIETLTGTVDKEITNAAGDKFVGKLKDGKPDEGTMVFAATGHTETGKWHNDLTPSKYQALLVEQEKKRQQQKVIDSRRNLKSFEDYICENEIIRFAYIESAPLSHGASIKLAQLFTDKEVLLKDMLYICKSVDYIEGNRHITMTLATGQGQKRIVYVRTIYAQTTPRNIEFPYPKELTYKYYHCLVVDDPGFLNPGNTELVGIDLYLASDKDTAKSRAKGYYTSKYGSKYGLAVLNRKIELGMTVEMVQAINGKGNISQHVSDGQTITVLAYGGVNSNLFATVISPINTYTFVNGRLTTYTTNEGQGTIIWN